MIGIDDEKRRSDRSDNMKDSILLFLRFLWSVLPFTPLLSRFSVGCELTLSLTELPERGPGDPGRRWAYDQCFLLNFPFKNHRGIPPDWLVTPGEWGCCEATLVTIAGARADG